MNKIDGCTKDEIRIIYDAIIESIKETIIEIGKFRIKGFGSFELKECKERVGRHPKTGEVITIPAFKAVKFKCTKIFKSEVNK